jgi:hypothetical protein
MTKIMTGGAIISAAIGFAVSALAWCRADEPGQVCEFKLDRLDRRGHLISHVTIQNEIGTLSSV